jgi:hypothetical protein
VRVNECDVTDDLASLWKCVKLENLSGLNYLTYNDEIFADLIRSETTTDHTGFVGIASPRSGPHMRELYTQVRCTRDNDNGFNKLPQISVVFHNHNSVT